jgi:hypothetical protein
MLARQVSSKQFHIRAAASVPERFPRIRRMPMNYQVNAVAASTGGYGFSIIDSPSIPLVHFEFEHEDKAKEAQRIIGQIIAIATKITPAS